MTTGASVGVSVGPRVPMIVDGVGVAATGGGGAAQPPVAASDWLVNVTMLVTKKKLLPAHARSTAEDLALVPFTSRLRGSQCTASASHAA